MTVIAVLDVGKTSIKLVGVDDGGQIVWTDSIPNRLLPGPPYVHHDLAGIETWLVGALGRLNAAHPVTAIVAASHGGSGVLVGDNGPALPMIDYEQAVPPEINAAYAGEAGSWRDRGCPIMLGAAHGGRQLFWIERCWPEALAGARGYLNTPQYWSWRLSGVMANEVTSAAAQSHLWSVVDRRPTALVTRHGWQRLLPPMRPAWEALGPLKPDLAAATGIDAGVQVHCGIHDSSANFYLYQAAGLTDFTVISTGTWLVGMTDQTDGEVPERPGSTVYADIHGQPVPGNLCMGGREFSAVAGDATGPADAGVLADLVRRGTMPLPVFDQDDGLFPGLARRGRIIGPPPETPTERFTLAVLYAALLTVATAEGLPRAARLVLDGSFVREPLYAAAVAGLMPDREVLVNPGIAGIAAGAAALTRHDSGRPAPLSLDPPVRANLPDLGPYLAAWRAAIQLETENLT